MEKDPASQKVEGAVEPQHTVDTSVHDTQTQEETPRSPTDSHESNKEPSVGEAAKVAEKVTPIERSRAKIALIMLSLCMAVFLAALDVVRLPSRYELGAHMLLICLPADDHHHRPPNYQRAFPQRCRLHVDRVRILAWKRCLDTHMGEILGHLGKEAGATHRKCRLLCRQFARRCVCQHRYADHSQSDSRYWRRWVGRTRQYLHWRPFQPEVCPLSVFCCGLHIDIFTDGVARTTA